MFNLKKKGFKDTYAHFGVKVKRDHVVFIQIFKIGFQTVINGRARRELSMDVAVGGAILKTCKNTT